MTRFIKYLHENEERPEIIDLIEKNCKPYLKKFKHERALLYSGRKEKPKTWFEDKIRKDRKPKDTPEDIHNILNSEFKKKTGIPLRSQSIFTYTSPAPAGEYGHPFVIIPIGDFQIWWNPHIIDLYNELSDMLRKTVISTYLNNIVIDYKTKDPAMYDKIINFYKKRIPDIVKQYTNKVPTPYINSEIMLVCDKYYALSNVWMNTNNYYTHIWEMFRNI